jgi:cation diffusion facilitator family transporter
MADETKGTVLAALLANLGVGLAKAVGGVLTGSSALLAEAAHSVADSLNEIFLLFSLSRAARPADATHPFGYGKERFFWSLLAAVGIFVSGAGFSIAEGVHALLSGEGRTSTGQYLVIYAVLAVSLVLEGASLAKALRQVRREAAAARRPLVTYILRSPDPTVKTVASEDTIAVVGVLVATAGTALHQITGSARWDAGASIVIGVLLGYVAYVLGRDTKELLIGEAADPAVRLAAYDILTAHEEVSQVAQMLTMQLAPDSVLVAARVQFLEHLTARELERVCTEIEQEMRARVPVLKEVFLDPSLAADEDAERVSVALDRTLAEVRRTDGDTAVDHRQGPRSRTGRRLSGPDRRPPGIGGAP